MYPVEQLLERAGFRQAVGRIGRAEQHGAVTGRFKFGSGDLTGFCGGNRKGNERGRHGELFKRAAHGVFAPDGGDAKTHLRTEGA